jgi:hypothetical protein
MVLSWDVHQRLCRLPGVCLACFGLGAMAIVPAFHDASSMVREFNWCPHLSCLTVSQGSCHDVLITVERYIPTLNSEFLFLPNYHFCTSLSHFVVVPLLSSLSYTFTLMRPIWGLILTHSRHLASMFISMHCLPVPLHPHCFLPLNLHHYHKVLQHIEVLC